MAKLEKTDKEIRADAAVEQLNAANAKIVKDQTRGKAFAKVVEAAVINEGKKDDKSS